MGKSVRGATPPPNDDFALLDSLSAEIMADIDRAAEEAMAGRAPAAKPAAAPAQAPASVEKKSSAPIPAPVSKPTSDIAGSLLYPWGDADSPSPFVLGLPAVMDDKTMLDTVKKRKGFESDDDAKQYIKQANQVFRSKEKYSGTLRDLGVGDPGKHLEQEPEKLGQWYKDTRSRLQTEIAQLRKNTSYAEDNAPAIAAAESIIKQKEEQLTNLNRIKDEVLTIGLAKLEDPAKIGLAYAKIYEPEKLNMIKKRMGIPAAMDEEVLTRVDQDEMKKIIPQSLLYDMELKGSTIAMNRLSDKINEKMPDFNAASKVFETKFQNLQEAKLKAKDGDERAAIDAQILEATEQYQSDPAVAEYAELAQNLHTSLRNTIMLPGKFPKVAEAFKKKAAIEKKYEEANPFARQLFQMPNFDSEKESGSYGILGGAGKGFMGVFGGVAKTLMNVSGQLGIVPKEQAYLRNVEIQDEIDTEFYTPEGARLEKNAKYSIPTAWENMIKDIGLDRDAVEQLYGTPETKFNPGGILTTMGETTGQVLGQAALGRGIGMGAAGVGSGIARIGGTGTAVGRGLQKFGNALKNPGLAQDEIGMFASTFATTYGDNFQTAIDNGLSIDDAETYAGISSLGTAMTEMISPDTRLARRAAGAIPSRATMQKTFDVLNNQTKPMAQRIVEFTKQYGKDVFKNVAAETIEEVADVMKTHVLDAAYDIDTTKMAISEDASTTAMHTAIGMIPMALAGGYGATSRLRKEALWSAGNNPDVIKGFMNARIVAEDDERRKADLQAETNKVLQVVNTMQGIVSTLPDKNRAGRTLTEGEKMDLAEKLFKSRKLRNDAANTQDAPLQEPILEAAKAAEAEATDIISGVAPAYIIAGQSVTKKQAQDFLNSPKYKAKPADYQVGIYNDPEVDALVIRPENTGTETAAAPVVEGGITPETIDNARRDDLSQEENVSATVPGADAAQTGQPQETPPAGTPPVQTQPDMGVSTPASVTPVVRVQGTPLRDPAQMTEEERVESEKVGPVIRDKFRDAPKAVADKQVSKTLPDGSKVTGRYVLFPADAVTPSHNPESFQTSEGYPLLPGGQNPNDNDYSLPANMAAVSTAAGQFDDRALQDVPTVTPDGVIIDGNNRTMSGQLAARQGTDEAYNAALRDRLPSFGLSQEDYDYVAAQGTPRLGFVTNEVPAYTTDTFAKFNKNQKKEKSPMARAIELGRTTPPRVLSVIGTEMDEHDTMSDFYKSKKSVRKVFDTLVEAGVILPNEMPRYFDRGASAVTASGKEFLESLMLGNVVGEAELALLNKEGIQNYRQKIVRNVKLLAQIAALGPDHSLKDLLNEAIRLKNELVSRGMSLEDYAAQMDMFSNTLPSAESIIMFYNIDGNEKDFKDFLKRYLSRAELAAAGAADLFTGEVGNSQDEILADLSKRFDENKQQLVEASRANSSQQPNAGQTGQETIQGADGQAGEITAGSTSAETGSINQNPINDATQISQPVQDTGVPQQSGGSEYIDPQSGEQEQAAETETQPATDTSDSAAVSGDQEKEVTPAEAALAAALSVVPEDQRTGVLWPQITAALESGNMQDVNNFMAEQAANPLTAIQIGRDFSPAVQAAAQAMHAERNPDNLIEPNNAKVEKISLEDFKQAFPQLWDWVKRHKTKLITGRATAEQFFGQHGFNYTSVANILGQVYEYPNLADIRSREQYESKVLPVMLQAEQAYNLVSAPATQANLTREDVIRDIMASKSHDRDTKNIMVAILRAMKGPNFKFTGNKRSGNFFSLVRNVINITNPEAFSHEIGHFGYFMILSPNDRLEFARHFSTRFEGNKGKSLLEILKDNVVMRPIPGLITTNTQDSLNEYFAEQFRQYVMSNTSRETNDFLFAPFIKAFDKLITFWKDLVGEMANISRVDPAMIPFFDKIVDVSQLPRLQQAANREARTLEREDPRITEINNERNRELDKVPTRVSRAAATGQSLDFAAENERIHAEYDARIAELPPLDQPAVEQAVTDATPAAEVEPDATAPTLEQARAKAIQIATDPKAVEASLQDLFKNLNQISDVPESFTNRSTTGPTLYQATLNVVEKIISLGNTSFQSVRDYLAQNGAVTYLPHVEQAYKEIRDTYTLPAGMVLDDDAAIADLLNPPGSAPAAPAPSAHGGIHVPGSLGELEWTRTKKLTAHLVDYQIRAKQIQDEIKRRGGTLDAKTDYYTLFYLIGNRSANMIAEIDAYLGNERQPNKDSLIKRMQKEAKDFKNGKGKYFNPATAKPDFLDADKVFGQIGMYMYALHAPERNAYNAKYRQDRVNEEIEKQLKILQRLSSPTANQAALPGMVAPNSPQIKAVLDLISNLAAGRVEGFPLMPDGGSGMTNAQAEATIQAVRDAGLEEMFNDFANEYRENVIKPNLDKKYQYGLIDEATHDQLSNYYQHYIPLKAEVTEDDGYTTFSAFPDADLYKSKGAVDLLADQRVNPLIQAAVDLKYTIIQGEKNLLHASLGQLIKDNPDPMWSVSTFMHTDRTGEHTIEPDLAYKIDGKSRFIYIRDPELKKAVNKDAVQSVQQFKIATKILRYLSTVQTTISPSFIVNNALSDWFSANLNLESMDKERIMKKVNGYIWGTKGGKALGAARAIYGYEGKKRAGESEWQDWARRFALEGGKISYLDMYNTKDEIAKMKENFTKDFSTQRSGPNIVSGVRSAISYVERISTSVENGVRLATFRALVEEGIPPYQAADFAKTLTTDFNKKGNASATWNLWFQYFNAGVQGIRSGVNAIKYAGTRGIWLSGALMATGFGMSVLNDLYSDCDGPEKDTDCYWNLQEWEKESYLILPGGDGFFKLRLPRFWGGFYALGVKGFDAINGASSLAGFGKFLINTTWNTLVPFSGSGGLLDDEGEVRYSQLVPTLAQPFFQFASNEDVFGRPIYKTQAPGRPKSPDSQRAFSNTSGLYTGLADKLNRWTGGNSMESGLVDVSPNSIEYWAKFGFGGLYGTADKLYTTAETLAAGKAPAPKDIPIVSNLFTEPVRYLNLGNMYKMLENSGKELYSAEERQEFEALLKEATKIQPNDKRYLEPKKARQMRRTFKTAQRKLMKNRRLEENGAADDE